MANPHTNKMLREGAAALKMVDGNFVKCLPDMPDDCDDEAHAICRGICLAYIRGLTAGLAGKDVGMDNMVCDMLGGIMFLLSNDSDGEALDDATRRFGESCDSMHAMFSALQLAHLLGGDDSGDDMFEKALRARKAKAKAKPEAKGDPYMESLGSFLRKEGKKEDD